MVSFFVLYAVLHKKNKNNTKTHFRCNIAFILTLKDPFISESCIEIKIELNFYFHTFFVVPQKVL